ncbi:hypothetical protein COLO4_02469, partial [Corchorus olitorius]
DHALDDFVGQLRALVERLRHLHQRGLVAGARPLHEGIRDPNLCAVDVVVAQLHEAARVGVFFGRQREVAVPGDKLAVGAEHLVIDVVGFVRTQNLTRRDRQLQRHASVDFAQLLAEHDRARFQRAIVWRIRNRLGHQVRHRNAHRPQQQQRREHPVENFAEEGSGDGPRGVVFEVGEGVGEAAAAIASVIAVVCPWRRAGTFAQRCAMPTPRPGQPITHGQRLRWWSLAWPCVPGNSPARARSRYGCLPLRSFCAAGGCRPRWRCCSLPRPSRRGGRPAALSTPGGRRAPAESPAARSRAPRVPPLGHGYRQCARPGRMPAARGAR